VSKTKTMVAGDKLAVLRYLRQELTGEGDKVDTTDNTDDVLRMVKE